jgi:hypothetical protein
VFSYNSDFAGTKTGNPLTTSLGTPHVTPPIAAAVTAPRIAVRNIMNTPASTEPRASVTQPREASLERAALLRDLETLRKVAEKIRAAEERSF